MEFTNYNVDNNKNYDISLIIDIITSLLDIDENKLFELCELDKPIEEYSQEEILDELYDFAYSNEVYLNEIIWEEYQDNSSYKILAHGSRSGIKGNIRVDVNGDSNDFSSGFYCGETLKQAGMFVSGEPESSLYIIGLDEEGLTKKQFRVSTDWMLAVAYYRDTLGEYANHPRVQSIIEEIESCDYVVAPIADNRMFQIIDMFIAGEITDKQCQYALVATNLGYQYVFKKEKCLDNLSILEHLYMGSHERMAYNKSADIESNTSMSKSNRAKIRFKGEGLYIDELLNIVTI